MLSAMGWGFTGGGIMPLHCQAHIINMSSLSSTSLSSSTPSTTTLSQATTGVSKAHGVVDALLDICSQGNIAPFFPLMPVAFGEF